MLQLILASIAIGIFITYNIVMGCLFSLPCSLSYTYYHLNSRWPGTGWIFSAMLIIVFLLLIYPWIYVGTLITSWSVYLNFLPFISCVGVMFAGMAPNIQQDKQIENLHIYSASIAAICALLWIFIVCWPISYIVPLWILVCGGIAHLTKTAKSSRDWWLEMCAFGPTFTAILTELILTL